MSSVAGPSTARARQLVRADVPPEHSENDGPGSTVGENSGKELDSDIGAEPTAAISAAQRTDPLPHERRELVVAIEVVRGPLEEVVVFLEAADRDVAVESRGARGSRPVS